MGEGLLCIQACDLFGIVTMCYLFTLCRPLYSDGHALGWLLGIQETDTANFLFLAFPMFSLLAFNRLSVSMSIYVHGPNDSTGACSSY